MGVVFLRRPGAAAFAVLATLALAGPVAAQSPTSERREAAQDSLRRAERLADGRGVRSGRELTPALAQLAVRQSALGPADREQAEDLLARPTEGSTIQPGGPYAADATVMRNCSEHFCVHWVETTADAPPLTDENACPTPDYVDATRRALEQSYDVENTKLGWRTAVPDGSRGGDARPDVYLKQLNADSGGLYGYAAPDNGQSGRSLHSFLVLDNDYAAGEFPYGGDYDTPLQVTSAHEYNHVLQYAYDAAQDPWMFEATATWAEDKVFPALNDYLFYMDSEHWAGLPGLPLTSDDERKMYGSAIWNHWLERRYGPEAIRNAWSGSSSTNAFAPEAYNAVNGAKTFGREFAEFAASTVEWALPSAGIHDGPLFPDPVARRPAVPSEGTEDTELTLNHTSYAIFPVDLGDSELPLRATSRISPAASGAVALVGVSGSTVTKVLSSYDGAGQANVTLENPQDYDRIAAVVANTDIGTTGTRSPSYQWTWTGDGRAVTLRLSQEAGTAASPVVEEDHTGPSGSAVEPGCGVTTVERTPAVAPTPTPSPTATPAPTAVPTPVPTVEPPEPTSVRLSRATTRFRTAALRGKLEFLVNTNKTGRLTAKATVDRKSAKRLKMGRKRTLGTAAKTVTFTGPVKVAVKLSRKLRKALKGQRKSLKVAVRVTYVPSDGTAAVTRTLTVRLKR